MVEGSTEIKSEDISSQNPSLFSVGIEQASIPSSTRRGTHQIGFTNAGGYSKDADWHRLDGGHHKELESSRVHRSDFEREASSGENARYTASSTCSKPPQLRSDPHGAPLIGSVPVSSQLSNSPPIDTNYYLEFQQTVEESSRDLTRNPEHIEGSSDLSLMKISGNSGSVSNLLDKKDIVHPARRARNTDGDGELAFHQDAVSVEKQHPGVGQFVEVVASKLPVAGLETRITSGNKQTSDQTVLR